MAGSYKDPSNGYSEVSSKTTPSDFTDTRYPSHKLGRYHLQAALTQIPYFKKWERAGEDAYVISEELLCVADGVGGWNSKGVDPGIFSRELSARVWQEYAQKRVKERNDGINIK